MNLDGKLSVLDEGESPGDLAQRGLDIFEHELYAAVKLEQAALECAHRGSGGNQEKFVALMLEAAYILRKWAKEQRDP